MSNSAESASSRADAPTIHLFQIAYSPESRAAIGPGFAVLDNMGNERPDRFEYWPIRRFLPNEALDDEAYYGFFSPRFSAKTGLGAAQVRDFIIRHETAGNVFIFSPQPDMGTFFLNVFEQAEAFDQGMVATYQAVVTTMGLQIPVKDLIMDSRQIVFSNYFVAKPAFWRMWLQVADLFLDTTPYNAGTTANDALWAGLPLLTLSGRTYVARMAGSLLRSAGLNELITHDQATYEEKAVFYANNRVELQKLRDRLKAEKDSGKLFNTERFVREFEAALIGLYKA